MTAPQPPLSLTAEFETSYIDSANYPLNVIYKSPYTPEDSERRERFDLDAENLLAKPVAQPLPNPQPNGTGNVTNALYVVFREWKSTKFERANIFGDIELKDWLGDATNYAATIPPSPPSIVLRKQDPPCRFIYLWAEQSSGKLKVSREMLLRIFSYHQVMPSYLDFISVFGEKPDSGNKTFTGRSLRFMGFQLRNAVCNKRVTLASHGRSGRAYEMCYNLKMASEASTPENTKITNWSIRQAAFYHQFDVETGYAVWISTKAGLNDLKKKIELLTGPKGFDEDRSYGSVAKCFRSSLAVHILYCHWSVEGWQNYVEYLENRIEKISRDAVIQPLDKYYSRQYSSQDLQNMQTAADKTHEAIMIMQGNIDVMTRIQEFYQNLLKTEAFLQAACGGTRDAQVISTLENHVLWLDFRIKGIISDMRMHISRAQLLVDISADRNRIILQHLQGQTTEKMQTMATVSLNEAVVMRIITVVTVVFLPATFVSTFFSTDIVKYQGAGNAGGAFSLVALERWLEVTFGLTAFISVVGWIMWAKAKSDRKSLLPFYRVSKG